MTAQYETPNFEITIYEIEDVITVSTNSTNTESQELWYE